MLDVFQIINDMPQLHHSDAVGIANTETLCSNDIMPQQFNSTIQPNI